MPGSQPDTYYKNQKEKNMLSTPLPGGRRKISIGELKLRLFSNGSKEYVQEFI